MPNQPSNDSAHSIAGGRHNTYSLIFIHTIRIYCEEYSKPNDMRLYLIRNTKLSPTWYCCGRCGRRIQFAVVFWQIRWFSWNATAAAFLRFPQFHIDSTGGVENIDRLVNLPNPVSKSLYAQCLLLFWFFQRANESSTRTSYISACVYENVA